MLNGPDTRMQKVNADGTRTPIDEAELEAARDPDAAARDPDAAADAAQQLD